jgi:hypothetical protein
LKPTKSGAANNESLDQTDFILSVHGRRKERCGPIAPSRQIYGKAFQTAWPTALEFTLIALIGFADTLMVSEVGISAVAAVGITKRAENGADGVYLLALCRRLRRLSPAGPGRAIYPAR